MKDLDKDKFEKRRSSGRYVFGFRYFGKTNNLEYISTRNEHPLMPKNMTDEDVILISQLVDQASELLHKMLIERDLVPDEFKALYMDKEDGQAPS